MADSATPARPVAPTNERERIARLHERWKAAPAHSRQRRHLRRAYLRAIERVKSASGSGTS